jgi:hypothetical protein
VTGASLSEWTPVRRITSSLATGRQRFLPPWHQKAAERTIPRLSRRIGALVADSAHKNVPITFDMHDTHLTGTWSEVQAEKDLLRAEFPLSTRRLEITVEHLMNKTSGQALELNKRGNLINRLKLVS